MSNTCCLNSKACIMSEEKWTKQDTMAWLFTISSRLVPWYHSKGETQHMPIHLPTAKHKQHLTVRTSYPRISSKNRDQGNRIRNHWWRQHHQGCWQRMRHSLIIGRCVILHIHRRESHRWESNRQESNKQQSHRQESNRQESNKQQSHRREIHRWESHRQESNKQESNKQESNGQESNK